MAVRRSSRGGGILAGALAAILLTPPAAAGAPQISGRAPAVIDTATLEFAGQRVRLYGLQATAPSQTCRLDALVWACGQEARWAATNRVGNHWVVCEERRRDDAGTLLAVCYLGGIGGPELNAWLVEEGWALAERGDGAPYAEQEDRARGAARGLWRGQ